ncbi:MAG: hypothetical protein AAGN82_28045 [Myxococcota bacterium]
MRASAPGKLVLSGAYAVLEGAPALVAAVDRYVHASDDDGRAPPVLTDEVAEAQRRGWLDRAPWFDAKGFRDEGRKLGLGSSAAILVACMAVGPAALRATAADANENLGAWLFPRALAAHRAAQGGGSGVDVAAACFGGVLRATLVDGHLDVTPHDLPSGLVTATYACPTAASTRAMLEAVGGLRARDADVHAAAMAAIGAGARSAVKAGDEEVAPFIAALGTQFEGLDALGVAAGVPIVTPAMRTLDARARDEGARFGPSGAGGGDVALYYGTQRPSLGFRCAAEGLGLRPIDLNLGAAGVWREA